MRRAPTISEPPPVFDLVETAFHQLRHCSWSILGVYMMGTAPYVMALAWFINDMAHHPRADARCAPAAFVVAMLWMWCKTWQAGFVAALREKIRGAPPQPWTFRRVRTWWLTQTPLQAPALALIPATALVVLPLPWVVAWFENLSVYADASGGRLRENASRAWKQVWLWPWQNLSLTLVLALFGLFVAVNIACALMAVPLLLKMLFDVETHVSLGLASALNTTFLTVVLALTWLVMGPLCTATHVLRCFRGESITTGEDLHVALAEARKSRGRAGLVRIVTVVVLLHGLSAMDTAWSASQPAQHTSLQSAELDEVLDRVLAEPEFAWRLGSASEPMSDEPRSTMQRWLDGVRELVYAAGRWVRATAERFLEWLERLFRAQRQPRAPQTPWMQWLTSPGLLISAAICAVLVALSWLFWIRFRHGPASRSVHAVVAAPPNVVDENVAADELPPDRWRRLADELFERGEARLAIRALYLACLAELAVRHVIEIARSKSNLEYVAEMHRRARSEPERVQAFERLVEIFERAWYGTHSPSTSVWREMTVDAGRICA
jgi:hypothetical protein